MTTTEALAAATIEQLVAALEKRMTTVSIGQVHVVTNRLLNANRTAFREARAA